MQLMVLLVSRLFIASADIGPTESRAPENDNANIDDAISFMFI